MKTLFAALVSHAVLLQTGAAADTNSFIGEWRTDGVMTQFGFSVSTFTFNTNGTFRAATMSSRGPTTDSSGTYNFTTNKIFMVAGGRTNAATYVFNGDTLVIDEGPAKIFKLKEWKWK